MSIETKEQQLQWLLDAWEKHPEDNFASSLDRVMQAYGYENTDLDEAKAYMDVEGTRRILVLDLGNQTFHFQAHMYLPGQAERLLSDIEYTIRNYY